MDGGFATGAGSGLQKLPRGSLCQMDRTNASWIERLTAAGPAQNAALEDLGNLLLSRLKRAFRARTGVDEPLLEDAVQEALVKTLGSLHQFQGKSRFTTWATTIAVRAVFTELRRRHWKDVSLEQILDGKELDAGPISATDFEPQLQAEQAALVREMYRIIETQLTEKQRTALLAELKGVPLEEIGRRMGSNRNAIYKLTHDARKRLKSGLEGAGYTVADLQTA